MNNKRMMGLDSRTASYHRSRILLTIVAILFLSSTSPFTHAFAQQNQSCERPTTSLNSSPTGEKPDLVDQSMFKAAIDRINDEIEAQYASQQEIEPTPEGQQWLADRKKAKEDDQQYVFLVGKLDVSLPIDTQPELDLTESLGPMVLVTNVWGRTAEATGMQQYDTITKVSVDDPNQPFVMKVKAAPLDETAGALTAAAQHAIKLGKKSIELEVQRLIKGYYAPEDSV